MNDRKNEQYVFKFECAESWENLNETADENIRHCSLCEKNVHLVRNPGEFAANAEKGNCVYAVPLKLAGMPLPNNE